MMDRNEQPLSFEQLVRNAQAERAVVVGEMIARAAHAVVRGVSAIGEAIRALYDGERRRTARQAQIAIENWAGRY
jgi:hypothetical protein